MTIATLEEEIRAAFASVPAPPSWSLVGSSEGDEPRQVAQAFRDKRDWRLLSPAFLDSAPNGLRSAFGFFSDEALRFFLPAYLLADLAGGLKEVDMVFHLTYGLDDAGKSQLVNPVRYGARTMFQSAAYRFSVLDSEQSRVIASYLKHKLRDVGAWQVQQESIRQALRNYWQPRCAS